MHTQAHNKEMSFTNNGMVLWLIRPIEDSNMQKGQPVNL